VTIRARTAVAVALAVQLAAGASAGAAPGAVERPRGGRGHGAPRAGVLRYQIRDADGDHLIPAKLTVVGVEGTPTPRLGPRAGRRVGADFHAFHRVFSLSGEGEVALPPGRYDLFASRGPEWTVDRQRLSIGTDGAALTARLRRVVDTAGWISADLHVHTAWSRDSVVDPAARVAQLVADGVEVVGSSEHNVIADYAPLIAELGARHLLASVRGTEITSRSWGHLAATGLPVELTGSDVSRRLAKDRRLTAAAIRAELRRLAPDAIVTVCHPHILPSSYFAKGQLAAGAGRAARPGFSFDFDAVELVNGYHGFSFGRSVDRNLARWFALLARGHPAAGVGGSDSHELRAIHGQGGWPRTYLAAADDRPATATDHELVAAVRAGRALVTTGPFVRVAVGDREVGELAHARGGEVEVAIEVQAAPWVPVDRVTLYVDGQPAARARVAPGHQVVRYAGRHRLRLERDGLLVVRVDGGPLAPVAGEPGHPIPALAISNPIRVDADGDGAYRPPRAPVR
jgi:hypothetical protein